MIRVMKNQERKHWIACLNRAAQMTVRDLYEYSTLDPLGSSGDTRVCIGACVETTT